MPWAKGQSGNPAGRPKLRDDISRIARQYGPAGIDRLAQFAGLAPGGRVAENEVVQIAAIKELLDRGYGKATQVLSGDGDNPIAIDFRWADAQPTTPVIDAVADETNSVADETNAEEQLTIEWESPGDQA